MKKIIIAFFTLSLTFGVSAQSSQPRTVSDYFMLLPVKYLARLEKVKNRKSIIAVRDDKNGYLELKEQVFDGETGEAEIALFRNSNGEAVIAVAATSCGMDDCIGGLTLLQYRNGKWTNETERLMPKITGEILLAAFDRIKTERDEKYTKDALPQTYFELPRKGTTVKVTLGGSTASSMEALFFLKWNGAAFEISNTK